MSDLTEAEPFVSAVPQVSYPHLRLSWSDIHRIVQGGGSADIARRLRDGQRSNRLLLLCALIDEVGQLAQRYEPLAPLEAAWQLLERVQDVSPGTLDLILRHPYTGAWLGFVHRLLRGDAQASGPLWTDLGHLHSLAAAAGIRAGLDFETRVPVRGQGVMLPTLGMVRLAGPAPWADIHAANGRVEVRTSTDRVLLPQRCSDDAPGWWGLRQLVAGSGPHRLAIRLDDLDPYRGLSGPIPPRRVDDDEVKAWNELLQPAWELIVRHLPGYAGNIPYALESIVPYPAVLFRNQSGSTSEAFGGAIMERPADAATLAATLIHETQHLNLYGLTNITNLHIDDHRQRFYTLWRDDPRPIGGVLHGIYSFFGVTEFWRAIAGAGTAAENRRALFEFAYWRAGTWRTLDAVRGDPSLTEVGRRLTEAVAERLGPWQQEPVPDDIAALAASAGRDHHAGWRIRHLRPPAATVRKLAERWLSGQDAGPLEPTHEEPVAEPDGDWPGSRTDLVRLHLADPERGSYRAIAALVPQATAADVAYLAGNAAEARRGYQDELRADPNRASAWVGLGLAVSAAGNDEAASALLNRPELVRAVYREITARTGSAPDLDGFTGWWSRAATA